MKKKMYFVWANPKKESLTAKIVDSMKKQGLENGYEVSELDLYRSGFKASLEEIDHPIWENKEQNYSQEVYDLFDELKESDTVIFVFPIWWYSFPAILKGYIDRVWNYGLAYGNGSKIPVNKVRWIALAGDTEQSFKKRDNDKYLEHFTINSISSYCGITDAKLEIIYDTLVFDKEPAGSEAYKTVFKRVNTIIDDLDK